MNKTDQYRTNTNVLKREFNDLKTEKSVRKQIVASKYIERGEKFDEDNLTTKRALKGISAAYWDKIIGKKSGVSFEPDDLIQV